MNRKRDKARSPVQKRGIETRMKIIRAGMELFGEQGYHHTNAAEIAARAGMATGTFYSYFNDKKEVLLEGITLFYRDTITTLINNSSQAFASISDGRELVRTLVRAFHAAHEINPDLHREVSALILLDPEVAEINRREERAVVDFIASFLKSYPEVFRVSDGEAAALLVFRASDETIHRIKVLGSDIPGERLLAELEEMLCRYLLQKP